MNKKTRDLVKSKYNNKCAYCGCELKKGWHVDHIEPVRRNWWENTVLHPERETLENFNPSCASCNIQKNSYTLEQFRENIKQFMNSLNQYSTQYKFVKRYGLVLETEIDVKFYFETVGSHCH